MKISGKVIHSARGGTAPNLGFVYNPQYQAPADTKDTGTGLNFGVVAMVAGAALLIAMMMKR